MKLFIQFVCGFALIACGRQSAHVPTNHRPNDAQCLASAPSGSYACTTDCPTGAYGAGCTNDSDCASAGPNGRCVESGGGPVGPVSSCTYDTCSNDNACPTNQICACHGSPYLGHVGNTCIAGNCRIDADCGTGGYCSPASNTGGCGGYSLSGYYCHTAKDTCVNDSDCASVGVCTYVSSTARWECQGPVVSCT